MKIVLKIVVIAFQMVVYTIPLSAQILYTDFSPDIYLTNQPINTDSAYIDVDQDNLIDFPVKCSSFYDSNNLYNSDNHIRLIPSQLSFAFDSSPISQSVCGRINLDDNQFVGSNFNYPQTWQYAFFYRSGPSGQCGYGLDTSARYYPFAKFLNNDTLFGWIQISSNGFSMTIHDLAINLTPNMGLYTGQVTGMPDSRDNENMFSIYPNPVCNEIHFINHYDEEIDIEIFDLVGKSMIREHLKYQNDVIDISNLNSGLYFYSIYNRRREILQTNLFMKIK